MTPVSRNLEVPYTASLIRSMAELNCQWINIVGHANTPRARNILVHKAKKLMLNDGTPMFDDLVFIDADISWDSEGIQRMLAQPVFDPTGNPCVVTGAPQRRTDDLKFCCNVDQGENQRVWNGMLSGMAATAFMRIPREVLEALDERVSPEKLKEYVYQDESGIKPYFHYEICDLPNDPRPGAQQYMGEDYYFCKLCRDHGINVWIDPNIRLSHWHNVALDKVLGDYMYPAEPEAGQKGVSGEVNPEDRVKIGANAMRHALWGEEDPYGSAKAYVKQNLKQPDIQGWRRKHPLLDELAKTATAVAEVGVWKGASVVDMLEVNPGLQVLAVDTFRGSAEHWLKDEWRPLCQRTNALWDQFTVNMVAQGIDDRVTPLPTDSLQAYHIAYSLGWRFDFVHIDAGHDLYSCLMDLSHWAYLTNTLIVDDYADEFPGVKEAVHTFLQGREDWGFVKELNGKCILKLENARSSQTETD